MSAILAFFLLAVPVTLSVRGGVARLGGEKDHDRQAAVIGVSALWRLDPWLVGASFDGSSRIGSLWIGDVRHLFFAAAGGTSLRLSDTLSAQVLAETGAHRLSGTRFGPRLVLVSTDPAAGIVSVYNGTEPAWAPFVGLRPSFELIVAPFAVGIDLWGRFDLVRLAPNAYLDPPLFPSVPGAPLNALSFGADLHLAFRFE